MPWVREFNCFINIWKNRTTASSLTSQSMPITPDYLQVQSVANILKRIAFDQYEICFAADGNDSAVFKSESPCVDTCGCTKCFFWRKAAIFHKVV